MPVGSKRFCLFFVAVLVAPCYPGSAEDPLALGGDWERSSLGGVEESFSIRGTGDRNNPLRRRLAEPFAGDELFVRFRLHYDATSIDVPGEGDGEFFVLWLDAVDGGDRAVHAGNVPNVGVHVADDRNRFMVRYQATAQKFAQAELIGGRDFQVAARLWKSDSGADQPFDQLDLWIDPSPHDEFSPAASVANAKAPTAIKWFGFSTGGKTETTDRIRVSGVRLATSWRDMLGLPPRPPADSPPPTVAPTEAETRTVDFDQHVVPILQRRCFECHAGEENDSGLRLDVLDELLNQIAPRNAGRSRLIELVRRDGKDRMPPAPAESLTEEEVKVLSDWVEEGLAWNHDRFPTPLPKTDHWAFQPIRRPGVPDVQNVDWVRSPVDAFIARQQERLGVEATAAADWAVLRRRLAIDLTGLPNEEPAGVLPGSSAELHQRADRLVDELLASSEYGERWGRHWLDLARWAESNGHQHNRDRLHAWRYRDYVIDAFRHDKPFDRFIQEQIAGDELPYAESALIATGFLAAARYSGNELDEEIQRNDILVDVVNTTAKAFLGITMECAQCHTHKFDPISIRDYYSFQAFFAKGQPGNLVLQREPDESRRLVDARWQIFDDVHARLVNVRRKQGHSDPILVNPKTVLGAMKGAEREYFRRMDLEIAGLPQAWGWHSPFTASTALAIAPHEMRWPLSRDADKLAGMATYLRIRGDVKSIGPELHPAWPLVFGPSQIDSRRPRKSLADWIASPENPLTARVWVNRIWQWHFGRGLVETSGDFGTQGTLPTHPKLLDWLADELIRSGWSTRHIQKLILRSSTYRQASTFSARFHQIDAENVSYWRWRPRRMEAEAIRDLALAVAGELDQTVGGQSVSENDRTVAGFRRSIYLRQKRDQLPESQTLFDASRAVTSCSRRRTSTVALQPLYLLNSSRMNKLAAAMARRVAVESEEQGDHAAVAVRMALGREATAEELERGQVFIDGNSLADFCHALMNLNEFVYIN